MSNSLKITLVVCLAVMGGFVTVLAALGRPADGLISFIGVAIIPTIMSLVSANKAEKAETKATEAADSAQVAVTQTNGNTHRLLKIIEDSGHPKPEGYEHLDAPDV